MLEQVRHLLSVGVDVVVDASLRMAQLLWTPAARIYLPSLALTVVVVALLHRRLQVASSSERRPLQTLLSPRVWWTSSTKTDLQMLASTSLLKALLVVVGFTTSRSLALSLVRQLRPLELPTFHDASAVVVGAVYTVVLFVCWDASRFVVHLAMHKLPWLWRFHAVHHSAETLTPLSLYRVHPVESFLMQLRGVVVTGALTALFFTLFGKSAQQVTLLGVNALTFSCSLALSNLRHSHVFVGWGVVERLLISPAQHQLHHSKDHVDVNFGTWLSVWDQLFGSFVSSTVGPPQSFGVDGIRHTRFRDALLGRASPVDDGGGSHA